VQLLQGEQLTSPHAIQALKAAAVTAAAAGPTAAQIRTPSSSSSNVRCSAQLDPALAAAFIQAVYETVQQQQVMPEQQLQVELYKLQTQEYKYYAGGWSTGSTYTCRISTLRLSLPSSFAAAQPDLHASTALNRWCVVRRQANTRL
jgi:hypothetical protein